MDFIMNIIPDTIVDAFAKGNVLQILLFSIMLGVALAYVGPRGKVFVDTLDSLMQGMFRIVNMAGHAPGPRSVHSGAIGIHHSASTASARCSPSAN